MKTTILSILAAAMLSTCGNQNSTGAAAVSHSPVTADPAVAVEWDKTVHDFGDVSVADGPLSCTFTLTNTGDEDISIFEVVSSCGCTDVKFSRARIEPGQSATISATYKNEDGPIAFDKTLTVYIAGIRRPVILRLRGVVHKQAKSLSDIYSPEKLGDFGLKTRAFKTGTLKQGLSASETATVANLGIEPITVSFTEVSPQLSLSVTPNPIPSGSTANLSYTVKADKTLYGKNDYSATPLINGVKATAPITVTTWTQENFALWSQEKIENASVPVFEQSTFTFNSVRSGEKVQVSFPLTNTGKSTFHIYKADPDSPALSVLALPDVSAPTKGTLLLTLDTALLPAGENVIMLTLTTNSPQRPLVNLFVAGEVQKTGAPASAPVKL